MIVCCQHGHDSGPCSTSLTQIPLDHHHCTTHRAWLLADTGTSLTGWWDKGVPQRLAAAGYYAVGLDRRGHGASARPEDPAKYTTGQGLRDMVELADRLGLESYAAVGYSQGAIECAKLLTIDRRICCGVIGGQGDSICDGAWLQSYGIDTLAVALEQRANGLAADPSKTERMRLEGLADPENFFANILEGGGSLLCMANVQRGQSVTSPEELAAIGCPVMCLTGDHDFTGGDNAKLASYIPQGQVVYHLPNARVAVTPNLTALAPPAEAAAARL